MNIVIGALIAWIVAKIYYVRAANDLKSETKKLHEYHDIQLQILQAIEKTGKMTITKDDSGHPVLDITLSVDSIKHSMTSDNIPNLTEIKK